MTQEPGTLCHPAPPRDWSALPAPVLIQVPALAAGERWGARPWHRPPLRRRRRLRREVRLAGSALLLGMPLAAAALLLGGARPATLPREEVQGTRTRAEAEVPPVVSIAMPIEPEAPAPLRELVPPVQFPDYVLPDDGSEEAAHAGS